MFHILSSFLDESTSVFNFDALENTPLANININRWNVQRTSFELLNSDWVLVLEEDAEIHKHSLCFASKIMKEFFGNPNFRGINLGSYEIEGNAGDFSVVSQGLHGQASVLPSSTWKSILRKVKVNDLKQFAYDWLVEKFFRNGFVVVPNRSMFKDNGWENPTHSPRDPDDVHYRKLNLSFLTDSKEECIQINHVQIQHSWPNSEVVPNNFVNRCRSFLLNQWKFSKLRRRFHIWFAR